MSPTPDVTLSRFIPHYRGRSVGIINLNHEAQKLFQSATPPTFRPEELAASAITAQFVNELHQRLGLEASLGGYLEDRSFLWRGTYLSETGAFIHLGVDMNVPAGSLVTFPLDGEVLLRDDDTPEQWGWGPRLFIRARNQPTDIAPVYILAHLSRITVEPGDIITPGAVVATVGEPPHNGGWFPHLHLQKLRAGVFERYIQEGIELLDGYGRAAEIDSLRIDSPDPLE